MTLNGAEITTRFNSKCRVCGKWVFAERKALRMPVGCRHLTDQQCSEAPEDWIRPIVERETVEYVSRAYRLGQVLERRKWTFAHTMPKFPHYWTLRKAWVDDDGISFTEVIAEIRTLGEKRKWGKSLSFYYFDYGDWTYWSCSEVTIPPNISGLINRAKLEPSEIPESQQALAL